MIHCSTGELNIMDKSQAQLITEGREAERLLNDPTFRAVTQELLSEQIDQFTNSLPEQQFERELAYFRQQALQFILARLIGRVNVARLLIEGNEPDYTEE
jgi:hypothetical protein